MASERKFVAENVRRVLLKEYLMKEVSRAGFGGLDVQRTPMGTSVVLATERPGLVIGRRGQTIKNLTMVIEDRFGFENPQIEVHEVDNANLNAQIMAEKLAFSLERGWHFRRAGHSSVRRIMESGAKGCHIIISGKLTGQRHRTEKFKDGYIKFCGEPKIKFMDKGYAVAKLKQGVVGITVEIMAPGSKLPADIMVLNKTDAANVLPDLIEKAKAAEATPAEAPAEAAEKPKRASKKKAEAVEVEVTETIEVIGDEVIDVVEVDVVEAPAEAAEKPKKKAPAKKKADAEVTEAPVEAAEEKPKKKAPAKKKADAEVTEAAETVEEKPKKKAPAKKKADAEVTETPAEAAEKPKKKAPAKKKVDAEVTEAAEAVEEKPKKKAPAKKTVKKDDAEEGQ